MRRKKNFTPEAGLTLKSMDFSRPRTGQAIQQNENNISKGGDHSVHHMTTAVGTSEVAFQHLLHKSDNPASVLINQDTPHDQLSKDSTMVMLHGNLMKESHIRNSIQEKYMHQSACFGNLVTPPDYYHKPQDIISGTTNSSKEIL